MKCRERISARLPNLVALSPKKWYWVVVNCCVQEPGNDIPGSMAFRLESLRHDQDFRSKGRMSPSSN